MGLSTFIVGVLPSYASISASLQTSNDNADINAIQKEFK
jgi:hypothetical protein